MVGARGDWGDLNGWAEQVGVQGGVATGGWRAYLRPSPIDPAASTNKNPTQKPSIEVIPRRPAAGCCPRPPQALWPLGVPWPAGV